MYSCIDKYNTPITTIYLCRQHLIKLNYFFQKSKCIIIFTKYIKIGIEKTYLHTKIGCKSLLESPICDLLSLSSLNLSMAKTSQGPYIEPAIMVFLLFEAYTCNQKFIWIVRVWSINTTLQQHPTPHTCVRTQKSFENPFILK